MTPKGLPLSKLSGVPPSADIEVKDGKLPERLPAHNVAALGTALKRGARVVASRESPRLIASFTFCRRTSSSTQMPFSG